MIESYPSKNYHEYLKEIKKYEKAVLRSHGRNCSTCKFYSIILVEDRFHHYCKISKQQKEKNDKCILWSFNRPAKLSEDEFYDSVKYKRDLNMENSD